MRSGWVWVSDDWEEDGEQDRLFNQLRDLGRIDYTWSSRADSDTVNARNLYFSPTYVNPSDIFNRYIGLSLRCLSTVLDW